MGSVVNKHPKLGGSCIKMEKNKLPWGIIPWLVTYLKLKAEILVQLILYISWCLCKKFDLVGDGYLNLVNEAEGIPVQMRARSLPPNRGAQAQPENKKAGASRNTHTQTIVLLLFWNLSGTTRVSRNQKGKTRKGKNQSGFNGARDSEWQWHLLDYVQVCSSSQATTPTSHHSVFYRPDAFHAAQPTASKHWGCQQERRLK